jgi:hypothetical protein
MDRMELINMKNNMPFIPTTKETSIGKNIVWRPVKSWHSANFAGEKLTIMPGQDPKTGDRSGCMLEENGLHLCMIPLTVTHRIYWNKRTKKEVSTFLSYPDAMGCSNGKYFWELLNPNINDTERFFGDNAEEKMEERIKKLIGGK